MDTSILEDLGLSKGEIKAYLTLLETGSVKVGVVIEKSGMASSAVHNAVHSLIMKGLVSYVKKGKVRQYHAVPARQLLEFVDDKKKKLAEILPELELRQNLAKQTEGAEIFEGTKGIMAMLSQLMQDAKKGDEYLFFPVNVKDMNETIQKFFLQYDVKRKEKGLRILGLASPGQQALFKKRRLLEMRYADFPVPSNISVCNDRIAIFSWQETQVGYLLQSSQIGSMFRQYFHDAWERARTH